MCNNEKTRIRQLIETEISLKDPENLNNAISLLLQHKELNYFIDLLNNLLLTANHHRHQEIVKAIQECKDPSSVSYIRQVLNTDLKYLDYTGSDNDAISKWFSHALASIGTKEAIELMREHTNSTDGSIRKEMLYRLRKLNYAN